MKLRLLCALSCSLALLGPAVAKAQDVFTFDSQPPTGVPPLASGTTLAADNNPARTALFTISSVGGNNSAFDFQSAAAYGTNQSGTVLVDGSGTPTSDTLTLTFAQPITSFAVDFAISDFNNLGPTPTDFLSVNGGPATGGTFSNGSLDFEGTLSTGVVAPFTVATITFSGTDVLTSYALDNITVTPVATVPEPGTIAFALALGVPAAWRLRKKLARK